MDEITNYDIGILKQARHEVVINSECEDERLIESVRKLTNCGYLYIWRKFPATKWTLAGVGYSLSANGIEWLYTRSK